MVIIIDKKGSQEQNCEMLSSILQVSWVLTVSIDRLACLDSHARPDNGDGRLWRNRAMPSRQPNVSGRCQKEDYHDRLDQA
nr:hypothetical protein CFP56_36291 [Quercus suber]